MTLNRVYVTAIHGGPHCGKFIEVLIVFAGYGVVAPEYKWNDYAGIDVKGKTVITGFFPVAQAMPV